MANMTRNLTELVARQESDAVSSPLCYMLTDSEIPEQVALCGKKHVTITKPTGGSVGICLTFFFYLSESHDYQCKCHERDKSAVSGQ